MRDSFLAVDAATDVGALARSCWSRTWGAGPDATGLHPRPALDVLDAARSSSPMGQALPAVRRHLGAIAAEDAEHVVVICDAVGRIL